MIERQRRRVEWVMGSSEPRPKTILILVLSGAPERLLLYNTIQYNIKLVTRHM